MTSLLLLFLCFAAPACTVSPTLPQVRELYVQAAGNEASCRKLTEILQPYDETNHPLFAGYKASAMMMMAKHVVSPFSRLTWFNKGKKMLEKAIQAAPHDVELRCLRFAAQSNIPSFLGYREHITADKNFILQQYPQVKDPALKKNIVTFLKAWGKLTPAEENLLK